ncbi:hypothetical protein RRF57_006646 [Xylaria bambusicola]|uniref:Uncharacterized protein n=1 Tax=Xylaria bambusicola TaxID=326684 RepID=A0AAN7UQL6_9PEZI
MERVEGVANGYEQALEPQAAELKAVTEQYRERRSNGGVHDDGGVEAGQNGYRWQYGKSLRRK